MSSKIHPTAIIESGAEIGEESVIGAYAYVGPRVRIGKGCLIHHHATIDGATTLGPGCEVYPYACIGLPTQDLKFRGGHPPLNIGQNNVFREFCTVHTATFPDGETRIGDHNHFLAYTHIAHDCLLGSHIVASNNATMAGHVVVGDYVVIGGFGGVHQFCRIGAYAMLGGLSKIVQDVPPFLIADGNPAVVRGYNKVGLERSGFTSAQMAEVKAIYRCLYRMKLNRAQALAQLASLEPRTSLIELVLDFAKTSERGFVPGAGT